MVTQRSDLEARLVAVEQRLGAVEEALSSDGIRLPPVSDPESLALPVLGEGITAGIATQLGRFLLIFGGAYLLRAITEYGYVPTALGLSMGAGYALFWLYMAYRTAPLEGRGASAVFYGVASTLLIMPLLIEASTRFDLLSGPQAVSALMTFCGLQMLVSGLRRLRSLAWLAAVGGIATAFVLARATHTAVPVSAFLTLLGLGSLWLGYWQGWVAPKWLTGLGACGGVVTLILLSGSDLWVISPRAALTAGVALLLGYLASFVVRTHRLSHSIAVFEPVQSMLMLAVTAWAASAALQADLVPAAAIGGIGVLLGLGAYGLALTPETIKVRGRNFYFYSTLGLALAVAGSAILLTPHVAAACWALLAVVMAWLSGRFGRVSLSLQCTFLLLAATAGSGMLVAGIQALAGDPAASWPVVVIWHGVVAAATVASLFVPVAHESERWGRLSGMPQLIVLALSVWTVGGLMVAVAAPVIAHVPGEDANLGALAALRTAVLAGAAVTLALSSRHPRWPEARWLAYPVLIVIAVKLVVEDFPVGHPASLFASLAFVGGAMIAVSRLLPSKRSDAAPE